MAQTVINAETTNVWHYANPLRMMRDFWRHRGLVAQFSKRETLKQYKGSNLGILWSLITPLLQLAVYTFVFSVIFGARFSDSGANSRLEYVLGLLAGLAVFEVFSNSVTSAPQQITGNRNLVTKVVFPLEILPVSQMGPALTESAVRVLILIVAGVIFLHQLPWTIVFLPLMYVPLILLCIGLGWIIAALGVFFRDINHLISVGVRIMFFLTPIFYAVSRVPEEFRVFIYLNPLAFIVTHFRKLILWGETPDWAWYLAVTISCLAIFLIGYVGFMKSKRAFADVL